MDTRYAQKRLRGRMDVKISPRNMSSSTVGTSSTV